VTESPDATASPAPPDVSVRPRTPRLIIAAVVLVTLAATAVLYWRWLNTRFPTSTLLFAPAPGEQIDDVSVEVAPSAQYADQQVTVGSFGPDRTDGRAPGTTVPILVEGGEYQITIRRDGEVLKQFNTFIPERRTAWINVTTRPSTP
jgi:hypothetical protein